MMWCDNCKKAVEPSSHNEYEIPDANVGGYETIQVLTCPVCGQEVYQEAEECVMCGELIAPGEALCGLCAEEIGAMVTTLAEGLKIDRADALNGITEYLNMEDR